MQGDLSKTYTFRKVNRYDEKQRKLVDKPELYNHALFVCNTHFDFKKIKFINVIKDKYIFKKLIFKIKYRDDSSTESEIVSFLKNQIETLLIDEHFNDIITFDIIVNQIEQKKLTYTETSSDFCGTETYKVPFFEILSEFTIKFSMNNLAPKFLELQKLQLNIDAMKDCCTFD